MKLPARSLLIVGSVALDSVSTPHGRVVDALGGSAVYASLAAAPFARPGIVAVVGADFPARHTALLRRSGVDLAGLEKAAGETFRWSGEYAGAMNEARTIDTKLNVFAGFKPCVPAAWRCVRTVFLGNIDPSLQSAVLDQLPMARLTALDTMNYWIAGRRRDLVRVIKRVQILLLNETEARALGGSDRLPAAARAIRAMGPRYLIIKRGEYGSVCFGPQGLSLLPALLLENVADPTGAGDSFAGAFMGYLAGTGARPGEASVRRALAYGTAAASFTVRAFSVAGLAGASRSVLDAACRGLRGMTRIPG